MKNSGQNKRGNCNMNDITISNLYNLDQTISKKIFEGLTYPWEVLPKISDYIKELGKSLSKEEISSC